MPYKTAQLHWNVRTGLYMAQNLISLYLLLTYMLLWLMSKMCSKNIRLNYRDLENVCYVTYDSFDVISWKLWLFDPIFIEVYFRCPSLPHYIIPTLVMVMALCRISDKPLPELKIATNDDAVGPTRFHVVIYGPMLLIGKEIPSMHSPPIKQSRTSQWTTPNTALQPHQDWNHWSKTLHK